MCFALSSLGIFNDSPRDEPVDGSPSGARTAENRYQNEERRRKKGKSECIMLGNFHTGRDTRAHTKRKCITVGVERTCLQAVGEAITQPSCSHMGH